MRIQLKPSAVCVFCSSSNLSNQAFLDAAKELGEGLAERELDLIYGGGNCGLMGIVAHAHQRKGGRVVGVILDSMAKDYDSSAFPHMTVTTTDSGVRKNKMAEMSGAFMVLPGGLGTYSELFEMLSLKQMGILEKPLIILNVNKYFEPLLAMLFHSVTEKTLQTEHMKLFEVADTVSEALDMLRLK